MSNTNAHAAGPALNRLDELIWIGDIPGLGAKQYADRTALILADRGETMTYAQLDQRADAFVAAMQARGLRPGDRVAYLGRNSDLFFPVLFGAIRAGLVLVALNWRLTAVEIAYQLRDSQSRLLIRDSDFAAAADEAARTLPAPLPMLDTEGAGTDHLRALLLQAAPAVAVPHETDQVVLQLYTSGTTGNPKGVLLSHGALSSARHAERVSEHFTHLETGCKMLSAMPNFHIGGMSWVLMGLVRFGTVVLTADPGPANMLKLIREYGSEHSFIVPTVLRAIVDELKARGEAAPRMRGIYYGAMPIGASLLDELIAVFNCPLVQFFGMTENTGSATVLGPSVHTPATPQLLKSVGQPYPGMQIEIRSPEREVLKPGEPGEIWIHSPTRMLGYWNLPEKTAEALIDGWYASGDGGYLDTEGYLYLTDRIKDMIVSGGENVYPVEVEEALRRHPGVLDAAAVGLPDERWGEVVAVAVERRPGATIDEEELRAFARSQIAGYKCPKIVRFVDALPRTASGKVQRAQVRQRLRDELVR